MPELEIAERIARAAHAGQTEESTGDDYILHVQRVVDLVDGDEAKAVAWLHDVIEDSQMLLHDLRKAGISVPVVNAVRWLTRSPTDSYETYIRRIQRCGNPLAIAVKIADLRDHLRPNCPQSLRPGYEKALTTLTLEAALKANTH